VELKHRRLKTMTSAEQEYDRIYDETQLVFDGRSLRADRS
jgi:hypothetical protein